MPQTDAYLKIDFRINKGDMTINKPATINYDVGGELYIAAVQIIGETYEALNTWGADFTHPGLSIFRNLSDTETILLADDADSSGDDLGNGHYHVIARIQPGHVHVFQPPNLNLYARTLGGTAKLEFTIPQE